MQQVRWVTFGVSSAITKTVMHFFPLASATSAPYPVLINLTVFANNFPGKSIQIEGGRLGQPDGFRLEEAVPELADALPGFVGLDISLSSPQPRIDLTPSCCVIEIISTAQSVKFTPVPGFERKESFRNDSDQQPRENPNTFPLLQDAFGSCSIVVVNASAEEMRPKIATPLLRDEKLEVSTVTAPSVAAQSLSEIVLSDAAPPERQAVECSWGLLREAVVLFEKQRNPEISMYGVYRENVTKRIVSIIAL